MCQILTEQKVKKKGKYHKSFKGNSLALAEISRIFNR